MKGRKSGKSKKLSEKTKEKIKRRMYELEEHTGFSQSDIAIACDVRVQYINQIYNGQKDLKGSTIQKLAKEAWDIQDYEFMQEGYFPEHIKVKKGYSRPKRKKNEEND